MTDGPGYRFEFRRFLLWLPAYLAIGFALYALSAGPIYWTLFEAYHFNTHPLLAILYLPLVWLSGHVGWLGAWMDWYLGLWVG